jgi:hypothetical protein
LNFNKIIIIHFFNNNKNRKEVIMSDNDDGFESNLINTKLWGEPKLEKLSKTIDINKLKQIHALASDEPLISSNLNENIINNDNNNGILSQSTLNKKSHFQPHIDSYIVNTIKLNQLLKSNEPFESVDFFKKNNTKCDQNEQKKQITIHSDNDAHKYLKDFIVIMCMHCGFEQISSFCLDILVDVLEHFIESFFRLLKSLQNIQKFNPMNKESTVVGPITNDYYSAQVCFCFLFCIIY